MASGSIENPGCGEAAEVSEGEELWHIHRQVLATVEISSAQHAVWEGWVDDHGLGETRGECSVLGGIILCSVLQLYNGYNMALQC